MASRFSQLFAIFSLGNYPDWAGRFFPANFRDQVTAALAETTDVGTQYAQSAAGTPLMGSSAETVLGSYTIAANTIVLGSAVNIRFQGIQTAVNVVDTLEIKLRVGGLTLTGTVLMDIGPTIGAANNVFTGEMVLVSRAAPGATAPMVGIGSHAALGAVGGAVLTDKLAATNFATNGNLLVEVTGQFSSNSAGNSCRLDILNVVIP